MPSTRLATLDDLDKVSGLYFEAASEIAAGGDYPKPQMEYIKAHLIKDFDKHPIILICEDDIVGFAALCLGFHTWSDKPYLTTHMVYLQNAHRKYGTIKMLYKIIKEYAQLQGLPYIDHYMFNGNTDGRRRLLRSLDLKEKGIIIGY